MYANIARYAGAAGKIGDAAEKVRQGLLPLFREQKGFLGYAAFASEQGDGVSIHLWESAEAWADCREKIRAWVQPNIPDFLDPTERVQGEVQRHAIAEPQSGGQGQSLYCLIRKAENLGAEMRGAARDEMLDASRKAAGFRGVYYMRSTNNPSLGASVLFCDTREHAAAVHETTAAIARERQPDVNVRVAASGQTTVLAMA